MTKEELKKEAEEYAKENFREEVRATARNAYLDCARIKEKRIAELEKENAELKLKLEALEGQTPWEDIKDKSELIGRLTRAKELIESLLYFLKKFYTEDMPECMDKAEQFISEGKE